MTIQLGKRLKNLVLIFFWLLTACQVASPSPELTATADNTIPSEMEVQEIPLTGPAASRSAEISGMAWFGDTLILLPQYPDRFGEMDKGAVFALKKTAILDFLENPSASPLDPFPITFDDGGLNKEIQGFQGFEAIAFTGERVYLTIEARPDKMKGYIVSGSIQKDLTGIRLDPTTLIEIPLPVYLNNISDESVLIYKDNVFTLFEANGKKINPSPTAPEFSLSLQPLGMLIFPNIEYRITDAAPPDQNGNFWAINYYFPPDEMRLKPQSDLLAERYGLGKIHRQNLTVERLVQFHIGDDEIQRIDIPPVQLRLEGDIAPRNWEAIALLDQRGFLIATDKFPRTILGFVKYKIIN